METLTAKTINKTSHKNADKMYKLYSMNYNSVKRPNINKLANNIPNREIVTTDSVHYRWVAL